MNKCPKEYGGPTINGKPVLSIEEVQQWFKEADCDASFDNAKSMAQALNHCALLAALWKNTPALKASLVSGATSLDLLQAIYRNQTMPLSIRMRAAIEALPFENPKLSATAIIPGGEDFEARLKRAIARSREGIRLIEHRPIPTPTIDK